jgi:Cft2 family RNA processing exonuclease
VKLINLTRRTEIGANSYYFEADGVRLILDCGMHPKDEGELALPDWRPIDGRQVNAILISHAHQDHIGTLPVLMRGQPHARVFMPEATGEIGRVLLHNSVNVMMRQREELGLTLYPLFTHREAERVGNVWHLCPYRQSFTVTGERAGNGESLTFEYWDAGHVLGSSGILLRAEGRTVFYTGDVNFDAQTVMHAAVFPESGIDVLIMECTRGDTPAPEGWSRAGEEKRLAAAIDATFRRGGCVLMPVFALGKTQEALAMFWKFRREKLDFPIYIGGLSSKLTDIYDRRASQSRRQLPRLQLMPELAPFVLNGRRVIENPQHSVLFVGYADPESPAGILQSARPGDTIQLDPDEREQTLRCHVEKFQFSAHASRESLLAYAVRLRPKKILLVHGDPSAVEWMRTQLAAQLPKSDVIVPEPGRELEL